MLSLLAWTAVLYDIDRSKPFFKVNRRLKVLSGWKVLSVRIEYPRFKKIFIEEKIFNLQLVRKCFVIDKHEKERQSLLE